jgi:hypothetical protein
MSIFTVALLKLFLISGILMEEEKIAAFIMLGILLLVNFIHVPTPEKIIIDNEEKTD